ncbi:MAG: type VI secretion system tube protein Hcp [Candidatus Sumerlaeia bacterium]
MNTHRLFLSMSLYLFIAPLSFADAPVQAYLNVRSIPGQSKDADHPNWIEINNYGMGSSRNDHDPHSSTPAAFQDFTVTKRRDKAASPQLRKACHSGDTISSVTLSVYRTDLRMEIVQMRFTDVRITSVRRVSGFGSKAIEEITFGYSTIIWIYKRPTADGGVVTTSNGWDVVNNRPLTAPPDVSARLITMK